MAFLKIWRTVRRHGVKVAVRRSFEVAPSYVVGIRHWQIRRCLCCERLTLFLAQPGGALESRACLFCSANQRYELLAAEIRSRYAGKFREMDVLELDPHSPLKPLFSRARRYVRSFYEEGRPLKSRNGAVFEDITALSFADQSFDLIISSDVLEHVPDLEKAFGETARVLRSGGAHLFTVPPRAMTRKRAMLVNRQVQHLEPPEYHRDPLCPTGILAFWDIGPDLQNVISVPGLKFRVVRGPAGNDGRVVWMAERVADEATHPQEKITFAQGIRAETALLVRNP